MKKFYLESEDENIRSFAIHKSSSLGNLTCRMPSRFVKNGSRSWLILTNGKIYTNAIDDLKSCYGCLLDYKTRSHMQWTYMSVVNLLYGANLISKTAYDGEVERHRVWQEEQERDTQRRYLLGLLKKLGISPTPKQKKILGVKA